MASLLTLPNDSVFLPSRSLPPKMATAIATTMATMIPGLSVELARRALGGRSGNVENLRRAVLRR